MVFHCRCFSSLLEVEEHEQIEYETRTQTRSTATETFYTAFSDFNRSASIYPANSSETSNLANERSNLRVFTVAELKTATNNFCRGSKIGEGGFGSVYKGVIKSLEPPFHEIQVAVKLAKGFLQGRRQWETEIDVLGAVEHPNLVKLIGYCAEDEEDESETKLLLVYEYMVNGSVRDHLSGKSKIPLSWNTRLKVAQDAARGLTYLHEQMDSQIILRDFKSPNILLDGEWNAKLSDFGVARLGPGEGFTHISTNFVGTMGYAAPEYISVGRLTSKTDVWCYGMFLYEFITGMRPLDTNRPRNKHNLINLIKPYLRSINRFKKIIDPRLEGDYSLRSVLKLSIIANRCLSRDPESRPKMSEVQEMVNQLIAISSEVEVVNPFKMTIRDNKKGLKWLTNLFT